MDEFAARPDQERRDILQEAASRLDVVEIIIEKDFWVCWTLKRLFSNPALSSCLTFKGGTSLSKAYGMIERFSEDIDLTISRSAPLLCDGKNPMEEDISGKERARRLETLKENAQRYVEQIILPALTQDIAAALGEDRRWKVTLDPEDPDRQTLLFYYPKVFAYGAKWDDASWDQTGWDDEGYIRPQIKLEFGARGETEPHESRSISSYVAQVFPAMFADPACLVPTLAVERSFWEKATILHALHHGSKMRDRMSRHYYDTYMLEQRGVADKALQNPGLLDDVVRNKSLLFKDTKASYETATLAGLRLLPADDMRAALKKDYAAMQEMFIGDAPDFKVVMQRLAELEDKIHKSA